MSEAIKESNFSLSHATKPSRDNQKWTKEEDDFLRENYDDLGPNRASKALSRSLEATRVRARGLGVTRTQSREWTIEENDFIRRNYAKMSLSLIHI